MTTNTIPSRPRYERLRRDESGRRHLLVTDSEAVPAQSLAEDGGGLDAVETWTITRSSRALSTPLTAENLPRRLVFRSNAHLMASLEHRLKDESIGFRLYAVGTEPFLWDVAALARGFGLSTGECFVAHAGSLKRRVICVHCKAVTDEVVTNIVACSGCGAQLLVRDHFSKRLAAFMGVQIDSEVPGDLPPVEEVFP